MTVKQVKKNMNSFIREIDIVFKTLETEKIKLNNPAAVVEFIREKIAHATREMFILLCLDNKNTVVSYSLIAIGTLGQAIIHPREIFVPAIMSMATGIIVAHNHPSGSVIPSAEDISTTKRIEQAGEIIGIPLMDHIIVGYGGDSGNFYSMKENGYVR